jgi:hypothetical protein
MIITKSTTSVTAVHQIKRQIMITKYHPKHMDGLLKKKNDSAMNMTNPIPMQVLCRTHEAQATTTERNRNGLMYAKEKAIFIDLTYKPRKIIGKSYDTSLIKKNMRSLQSNINDQVEIE